MSQLKIYVFLMLLVALFQRALCYKSNDEDDSLFERLFASGSEIFQNVFQNRKTPCTCGIFLEGQYSDDLESTKGPPAYFTEFLIPILPCNYRGDKKCQDRCLDEIIAYIPRIGSLMCSAVERNCFRERAALFVRNCHDEWKSTGLTLGREFCCLNGYHVKCPRNWFTQGKTQLQTASSIMTEFWEPPNENRRSVPEVLLNLADKAVDIVSDALKKENKEIKT